jgi:hypothetical protein
MNTQGRSIETRSTCGDTLKVYQPIKEIDLPAPRSWRMSQRSTQVDLVDDLQILLIGVARPTAPGDLEAGDDQPDTMIH